MSDIEQITGALEQVLNISDAEQTSTDTEQTLSDTDPIVTISDTEQVSSDTEATSGTEQISSDTEKVTSDTEATSGTEHISSDTEQISSDTEKVTSDTEQISSDTEKVTSDTEQISSDTEKVASDTEKVASDTEKVASDTEENLEKNSLALEVEDFCLEIYGFVFKEMKYILPNDGYVINDCEPQTSFSPQFILDVGKAVAFYSITYRDGILHILNLVKYVVLRRTETLEPFLKEFFELFFNGLDDLPRHQFFVFILAYCGFICIITDYFLTYTNTMDHAEKCYSTFKATIISKFEKIQSFGGWNALHEVAEPYARLYGCELAQDKPDSKKPE